MSSPSIKIGIIGGSGFQNPSFFHHNETKELVTPFGKPSDVFRLGKVEGVDCVLITRHGPNHSIPPSYVNYRANIWGLKELGCTHIIATTACGSLQENIHPGDLVIMDSFIDRTSLRNTSFYDGTSTLSTTRGVCHIPMDPAFCSKLSEVLFETACQASLKVHPTGTVVTIEGPRFSTLAESKLFRKWGGDVVNMTTVPEVCLAKELGLLYSAIGLVTDYDCWNEKMKVNTQEVLRCFKMNIDRVATVIQQSIPKLNSMNWYDDIIALQKVVTNSIVLQQ